MVSFSLANSLISADMLSAVRERYKNTFSKASCSISCNKNRLETENIFLWEESIVKTKNDNKKFRVGDLNLGTVGNQKHTYCIFLFGLKWKKRKIKIFKHLKV